MTEKQLTHLEAGRNLWQEILGGIVKISSGKGKRIVRVPASSYVTDIRTASGLTQAQFARLLGVSRRTLEQWEQGRRSPSGAARTLLKVVEKHPELLRDTA